MTDSQYIKTRFETLIRNLFMKKLLLPFFAVILSACSSDPVEDFNSAVKQADQNNWGKAAKYAKEAAEANPTTLTEAFNAICLIKQDKAEEATEILKSLATKEPNNATIQFLCGKTLFSKGETADAYNFLTKSYNLDQSNNDCLALLFQAAVILNKKNAIDFYKLIQKKPNLVKNPTITNNLGVWYAQQNSPAAFVKFRVASNQNRNNSDIVLNTAIIYDKKKMYPLAQKTYEKYLRLTKDNPVNHLAVTTRIDAIQKHLSK